MAFDGFVFHSVAKELHAHLIGGKIQKVYEPTPHEILLSIYANGSQYCLSINTSSNLYSVFLTTNKKENPIIAPNFCMLLRKHLINTRITNISTLELERILIIEFSGNDENHNSITKKLVVELMGKHSNILLLNEENRIIDALKHYAVEQGASRNIMPRYSYIFPTSDKVDIGLFSSFENSLPRNTSLSSFFMEHFIGISKTLIEHVIFLLAIEDILTPSNYNLVAKYLLNLKQASNTLQTEITLLDNDYTLVPSYHKTYSLQVNFFLDNYYFQKEQQEQFTAYRNQLLNFILAKLKKISKKLSGIDEKLKECENKEQYQLYGELITSYLYQISKEHISHITLPNFYHHNELIDIPLDIALSPVENAKKFFKKYQKLKNTFTFAQEQKIEVEKEICYLESIVYEIQVAKNSKELDGIYEEIQSSFTSRQEISKKKHLKKKSRKEQKEFTPIAYQLQGFKILVGKNNKQNDELTFKIAKKEDVWFHVKDLHGSHVILVTCGKTPSQEIINECASIAAFHSKGRHSSNVPVDYTFVKNVKKPNKAKPGMVIYTNQKTINVNPKESTSTP